MQARPTVYKGIQMRSRLEARMAQHLDELGFLWDYEPMVFASEGGQYLPDFGLYDEPDRPSKYLIYAEVKPTVDHAYRAMAQMQIIWESEPSANLGIWTGDGAVFFRTREKEWFQVPRSDLNLEPMSHAPHPDDLLAENRLLRQELADVNEVIDDLRLTIRRLREDLGRE